MDPRAITVIGMIDDMDDDGTRVLITPIRHVKEFSKRSKAELSSVLCTQILPTHFRLPHHCLLEILKLKRKINVARRLVIPV